MDLLQLVCVLLLTLVSRCAGKAFTFGSRVHFTGPDPVETIPTCHYENKPCMIMVRDYHDNGTLSGEFRSSTMCRCGRGPPCPSEWDEDRVRTVTRYLRTQGKVMTLQLKFCRPVQTERICEPHEVALTLRGVTVVPQEVTSINCRCADNTPLHLQRVWFEYNIFTRNQNFVCSMPDCASGDVPCLLNYRGAARRETTYLCQCPGDKQCRQLPRAGFYQDYILGRCGQ